MYRGEPNVYIVGNPPIISPTSKGESEVDRGYPMFFVVVEPVYNYILFSLSPYDDFGDPKHTKPMRLS